MRSSRHATAKGPHRACLGLEHLEARDVPTAILFDYRFDVSGFFNSADRRATLQLAGDLIGARLRDHLGAITPGGGNTWTASVVDPTGQPYFVPNLIVPEDTLVVFVGAIDMQGGVLGVGGPGGTSTGFTTNPGWPNTVFQRGNPDSDFSPWGGSLFFDLAGTDWYFGTSAAGLGPSQTDFLGVAMHELGHLCGLFFSPQSAAQVANGVFTGPATVNIFGGGVPMSADGNHFNDAVTYNGLGLAMDTTSFAGTRTLFTEVDYAALSDSSWQVSPYNVVVGDFTGDGRTDLAGRHLGGGWWTGASTGSQLSTSLWTTWNEAARWRDVGVGDFNNDGRDDVVGRTSGGQWWVGLSTGTGFSTSLWASWNEAAIWRNIRIADFTGDGRSDIAGRTVGGEWWVAASTGSAFTTTRWTTWNEAAGWSDVLTGDFTADGRADIVGRSYSGEWWAATSTGTAFNTTLWTTWNEFARWRDVSVGDFNNDGRDDIVGREAGGGWWVGVSSGTAFSMSSWASWNEAALWRDVSIGDFNGDGRADIAGRTAGGEWWVAASNGSAFVTTRWATWNGAAGWRDVSIGDYDNDGRDDIAGRSYSGQWWIARSTGSQFTTTLWASWNEALV